MMVMMKKRRDKYIYIYSREIRVDSEARLQCCRRVGEGYSKQRQKISSFEELRSPRQILKELELFLNSMNSPRDAKTIL